MKILAVILPVLIMLAIGFFIKKIKLISQDGIDGLKNIVLNIMLPIAIFHALGTAEYSGKTAFVILIMFGVILLTFLLGFACRYLLKEPYRKYVPYLVSVYEGGLMGYPLYMALVGKDNLSYIALLDIACLLFGFSVYMGLLRQTESGEKFKIKPLLISAIKTPAFIATLLGLIAGVSGVLNMLVNSAAGEVYLAVENIITVGMSGLVLLIVGYNFSFKKALIVPCLKTIAIRLVLQGALAVAAVFAIHALMGDKLLDIAVIMMMASPATFSLQSFIRDEEGGEFVATENSLYCVITIIVYIILAVLI